MYLITLAYLILDSAALVFAFGPCRNEPQTQTI